MARQPQGDIYTLEASAEALQVSRGCLDRWIQTAKLREQINKQRFPDDMRQRFLTRQQLEQLAAAHRRQLTTPTTADPLSALTKRLEALEQRMSAVEERTAVSEDDLPI